MSFKRTWIAFISSAAFCALLLLSASVIIDYGESTTPLADCIYGIMVIKSAHWVLDQWLNTHAAEFCKLAILDGTAEVDAVVKIMDIVSKYQNVVYAHEFNFPSLRSLEKTDNVLRSLAFSMLDLEEVLGHWVVIANPYEFYIEKFSAIAIDAELENANIVRFKSWNAIPYLEDRMILDVGILAGSENFNILSTVRYCLPPQPDYNFTNERMFLYSGTQLRWGTTIHFTPEHFPNPIFFSRHPKYIHYKIHNFDSVRVSILRPWLAGQPRNDTYSTQIVGKSIRCSDLVKAYCSTTRKLCGTLGRLNFTENEDDAFGTRPPCPQSTPTSKFRVICDPSEGAGILHLPDASWHPLNRCQVRDYISNWKSNSTREIFTGKTLLHIGDSLDRNLVTQFCANIAGKYSPLPVEINGKEFVTTDTGVSVLCYCPEYNFRAISFFTLGLSLDATIMDRAYPSHHVQGYEPVVFEDRLQSMLFPALKRLGIQPDMVVAQSGLWDVRWKYYAAKTMDPTGSFNMYDMNNVESLQDQYNSLCRRFFPLLLKEFPNAAVFTRTLPSTNQVEDDELNNRDVSAFSETLLAAAKHLNLPVIDWRKFLAGWSSSFAPNDNHHPGRSANEMLMKIELNYLQQVVAFNDRKQERT